MSTPLPEGGATVNPHKETVLDRCEPAQSDRKFAHHWQWKWDIQGTWTNIRRCTICGKEEENGK